MMNQQLYPRVTIRYTNGALYSNVPTIVDIRWTVGWTSLAHPKSVSTTLPPLARDVMRMLSGFKSRWTMSLECR